MTIKQLCAFLIILPFWHGYVLAEEHRQDQTVDVKSLDFSSIILNEQVPAAFLSESNARGTVERLDYDTFLYAYDMANNLPESEWHKIPKSAFVYLPHGYDPNKQYNIFYLLHGGGGNEREWFGMSINGDLALNNNVWGRGYTGLTTTNTLLEPGEGDIVRILDNLIAKKIIDPLIVVTPTMYYRGNDLDIDVPGDRTKLNTDYFAYELQRDLMPAVEGKYSTYAKTLDKEGLIASRNHRALAGLSMGSMTTWRSGLQRSLPYISWFGNYSAGINPGPIPETFKETGILWDLIEPQIGQYPVNALLSFEGTSDVARAPHEVTFYHLLGLSDGHLVLGKNAAYYDYDQWIHGWYAWVTYFYNSVRVFYQ